MAEKYLSQIYYDPESPASFGGVDSIYRAVKNEWKYEISRNKIRQWLLKQDAYSLHKPVRYRFRRNRVIVGVMDDEWETDLVIMDSLSQQNNGYKYIRIGMRPVDVNKSNENIVWQTLYGKEFNIGDQVRISKAKRTFRKGYLPNWTEEVFTVTKRVPRRPPVYNIADYDGEELEGTFYEQELQKVNKSDSD
ncbi:Hypothetical predicted protein [Paramuricea clavata]|uniref:Uncharacterized protein n=1 Tax=Paramuricea clavata TaxID=317549 RepID=A0A6S7I7H2_PARCT|nr:Hypothetical predicted protein [Paramuricea clavata]